MSRRYLDSLTTRLMLTFMLVMLTTLVAAGGLAYWFLRTQLENETWGRVAAQISYLITTWQSPVIALIGGAILVVLASAVLGGFTASRMTQPLSRLNEAALDISSGNLEKPVPIPEIPYEISALATAFEVSRRNMRQAIEDLSRAKAWAETLIQSVVEGIVTINEQGSITSFSDGAEQITGWRRSEVLMQPIDEIFKLPGSGTFTRQISAVGVMHQVGILNRYGQEITLAVTGARMRSPESAETQTALVLRNITDEEAAQQLRSYFLANISHEFRTPLAALNASVELLLEELHDLSRDEITELLESVHYSLIALQTLIDNLLESTSIEAGHFRIHSRPTQVKSVIGEAIRVMKPLLERRDQALWLQQPDHIPTIKADPTRLTQVLVNLLSNASKYSSMGDQIALQVELPVPNMLRISVADQGPGVPTEDQGNLFRRFVRLDERGKAQYGVGLGLSVVKTIVEEHGGYVGLDEREGGGSIFWFEIPMDGALL